MPNTKPLVCVACVCEKVLYERDGVLSAIRIVDVLYVPAQNRPSDLSDVALSVPGVSLNILVSLKSGDLKGTSDIGLRMRSPSGRIVELPQKFPVTFIGGEQGVNLHVVFVLETKTKGEFGLFWFDVYWSGEVLTSIPFKLVEGPPPSASAPETSLQ